MNGEPAFWSSMGWRCIGPEGRGARSFARRLRPEAFKGVDRVRKADPLEYALLRALYEEAGLQTDCCIKNLKGELVSTDEDQARYVVRDWYEGRECSAREPEEILKAAGLLARLHLACGRSAPRGPWKKDWRSCERRRRPGRRQNARRQRRRDSWRPRKLS